MNPIRADVIRPPSRTIFWFLLPWIAVFVIAMPFLVDRTAKAIAVLLPVELMALFLLLGLFDRRRFGWALRVLGLMLFLLFAAYFIGMLIESGGRIEVARRPGRASAFDALLGLLTIGLPGLFYGLYGPEIHRQDEDDDLESYEDEEPHSDDDVHDADKWR